MKHDLVKQSRVLSLYQWLKGGIMARFGHPGRTSGQALIDLIDEIDPDPEEWARVSQTIREMKQAQRDAARLHSRHEHPIDTI